MPKKTTIDDLAIMVKHGFDAVDKRFDQTATKEDLKQFATKEDLRALEQKVGTLEQKMDAGFFAVNSRIDLLHEDLSDLPDIREEVQDLGQRMERVEQKVGLAE